MIVAAFENTQEQLALALMADLGVGGGPSFIPWAVAILIIGGIGYIKPLEGISTAFMVLVIIVLFLKAGNPSTGSSGGFFAELSSAITSNPSVGTNSASNVNPISTINNLTVPSATPTGTPVGQTSALPGLTLPNL